MATLGLMLLGSWIGGAVAAGTVATILGVAITGAMIGAMVGGLIGAYIDANFLFAPDPMQVEGMRMGDIMMMSAAEGQGMFECHGIYNKIPGQCLYVSSIRETKVTSSFRGDALVKMADGTQKKIEDIEVGDKVLSCKIPRFFKKFRKNKLAEDVVTEVFKNTNPKLVYVVTDSNEKPYYVTGNHPAFVDGKWVQVADMKVGAKMLTCDGTEVTVADIERTENSEAHGAVYNFEVKNNHNYFVENTLWHNGKGGGGGQIKTTKYYYDCDLVVAACDATNGKTLNAVSSSLDGGKGDGFRKIWFNNKKVYDSYSYRSGSTDSAVGVSWTVSVSTNWNPYGGGGNSVNHFDIRYSSSDASFNTCNTGYMTFDMSATGASAGDNLSPQNVQVVSRSSSHVTIRYKPAYVSAPSDVHPNGVNWHLRPWGATGDAASNLWYGNSDQGTPSSANIAGCSWSQTVGPWKAGAISGSPSFHRGNSSTPCSVIAAKYGSGAPGFFGTAYVCMPEIEMNDFGNSVPQVTYQIQAKSGNDYLQANANEAIEQCLSDAGWTSDMYDTSGISDSAKNTLWGYATQGVMSLSKRLEPLMLFYDLRARTIGGKLYFYDADADGDEYNAAASSSELGCKEPTEPPQLPIQVGDTANWRLPSSVTANFFDINKSLQRGSEIAQKVDLGADREHAKSINFPLSSTAGRAKQRASQILWEAEQYRQTAEFRLPADRIDILVNDKVTVTNEAGETFKVRLTEVNRGDNFLHECMGILEDARFESFADDADDNQDEGEEDVYEPPPMYHSAFMNTAADDAAVQEPTLYIGGCGPYDHSMQGQNVVVSIDGGTTWTTLNEFDGHEAQIGVTMTSLPAWENPDIIDTTNTVRIKIYDGTLSTDVGLVNMLNGQNRIVIGGEAIGFQKATFISGGAPDDVGKVYDLSILWRNLRGNLGDYEKRMTHPIGESTMILNNAGSGGSIAAWRGELQDINTTVYYKVVPDEQTIADADGASFTFTGDSIRCLSPGNVSFHRFAGACDNSSSGVDANLPAVNFAANDLIVRFVRRGRSRVPIFSTTGMPLLPSNTMFKMEIMSSNADNATVLRTITHDATGNDGTNYPLYDGKFQLVYTRAQQTADFGSGSEPATIHVRIHQVGTQMARGYEADVIG